MAKVWDEGDNQFLRENYMKLSNQDLAEKFGVSKKSIQGKLRRLGLHRNEQEENKSNTAKKIDNVKRKDEKSFFRKKKLKIKIAEPPKAEKKHWEYVPREITERRKRATREFSNAMSILSEGDTEKALEEFDFIINTFKGEYDIIEKSQMYKRLLTRNQPLEPRSAEDFYHRGAWLYYQNKTDAALEHFQRALEMDPDYLDVAYNIACIYCRIGRFDECLDMLDRVLEQNPGMAETAMYDEDFEALWENEHFIELVQGATEVD